MGHSTAAMRLRRFLRSGLLLGGLLGLAFGWPGAARADHGSDPPSNGTSPQCPTLDISVAHGGSVTTNVEHCATSLFGVGFVEHHPTNGTAFVDANHLNVTYTHNGSATTTDSFVLDDGDNYDIYVTVTIAAPTSSISVSPNVLPAMVAGEPVSEQFTASGGTGPYTWSVSAGTLPAGLSLSSAGLLDGTPTERGDFSFSITATDASSDTGSASFSLTVDEDVLTLAPNPPPVAFINHPYSVTFTTDGGVAPRTVFLNTGSLPPGLSLGGTGDHTLAGTPTATGTYAFELRVEDSSGGTGTNWEFIDVTMTVDPQPTITVTPATLPDAVVGDAYNAAFGASGGTAPYTFAVTAGSLPAGLSLASNGSLTGTPTAGGSANFTVTATDDNGFPGDLAYTLEVLTPPSIVTSKSDVSCAGGSNGAAAVAVASGGTAPFAYSWSPSGGTGTTASGLAPGTYTVTVTDANGLSDSASVTILEPTALAMSPSGLPGGVVDTAYSAQLTASGGTGAKTFNAFGTLPAGLTMASDGSLSGTPTTPGTSNFDVQVTDQNACSLIKSYSITIDSAAPVAGDVSATVGYGSGANPITLDLSGGTADSVAVATAPGNGTAIASGTAITYQPDAGYAGADSFTYTASNADGTSAPATVSITVSDPVISVTASAGWTARIGESYSQTFTFSGGAAPYGYSVTGLPAGLMASSGNADSVTVSGTPTEAGSFTVTATATDSSTGTGPFTVSDSFTLQVDPPANFALSPTDPGFVIDYLQSYSQTFSASGGTAPYTYTLTGVLPAGLGFDGSTGVLSGTPTEDGLFLFTVTATDSSTGTGGPYSTQRDYTLDVQTNISLTPMSLPDGNVGSAYLQALSASGGAAPYTFSMNIGTSLPPGLNLAADGTISGTPTTSGTYSFNIKATDANGVWGSHGYNLTIEPATLTVTPAALPAGTVDTAYSQTIGASGGIAPYSFMLTAGALPMAFSLDPNTGVLSGSTSTSGTYNFDVRVTDSGGGTPGTATVSYTLAIGAPSIAIAPASLPAGTFGTAYSQSLTATGGTAPYSYAVTGGALPTGLSLSPAGVLSGTPNAAGTFNFAVTATDSSAGSGPYSGVINYSLAIGDVPPTAGNVTATIAYGSAATDIALDLGGSAATSVRVATAPAHGNATASGTTISYRPEPGYAGADSFTYIASNAAGDSAPATVGITVSPPTVAVTATGPLTARAGQAYSQTFRFAGGAAPYTGHAVTGMPAGLSVTASDADSVTVSGTPSSVGTFTLQVSANDSSTGDGPFTASDTFTLVVAAPGLSMTPAAGTLTPDYGQPYARSFSASGGTAPYRYALTGTLPAGLAFDAASGTLSGTPIRTGDFTVTVTATDSSTGAGAPFSIAASYTLQIDEAAIVLTPRNLPAGTAGAGYRQALAASGGIAPYTFAVVSGALPAGLSLATDGSLAGTPTANGTFDFSVQASDAQGQRGQQAYRLEIATAVLTLAPADLAEGRVGDAYGQAFTASGGVAPYRYAVTAGALPPGLQLAAGGELSGTPTTAGVYRFDVQASDSSTGATARVTVSYTLTIAEAPPVAVDDSATTVAERAVAIAVADNDSGAIDAITIAEQPAHGEVSVDGLVATYTPAAGFFGSDRFRYTAGGPGGRSAAATVTIEVQPLPVPVGQPQSMTVLAGQAVSFDAAAGATGGPFTGVAVTAPPAVGDVAVDGTRLTYTPPATAQGTVTIGYTLANAYGTSAPITATVTVNPMAIAAAHQASVVAGTRVTVELTENAHGGPFTGARVLSVAPATAGTAVVARHGAGAEAGYRLEFAADADFAGTAVVRYTLSNAHATSAPATVTIEVSERPDPAQDAEVAGLLRAQAASVRNLARGQLVNFQQRLDRLHDGRERGGFDNGLTFAMAQPCGERDWQIPGSVCRRPLGDEQAPVYSPAAEPDDGRPVPLFAVWASGAMRFGDYDPRRGASGFEFETRGISIGADYRLGPAFAFGGGLGYGRDVTDIGEHGSRSEGESRSAALYASYHPGEHAYLDGLLGYQWLSFDLRRHLTATGAQVRGERDGDQWFASLAAGYQWQRGRLGMTSYARLDTARATLDGYVEQGDAVFALAVAEQDVDTTTTSLGLHLDYLHERDWGSFAPQLRLEYQHDLDADSLATLQYADQSAGPFYRAGVEGFDRNRFVLGLGAAWRSDRGLNLRLEYRSVLGNSGADDQSLQLQIEKQY